MLEVKKIPNGFLDENCWLLREGKEVVLIDVGSDAKKVLAEVGDAKVGWILLTHSHYDHLEALHEIWKVTKAKVAIHGEEASFVEEGKCNPPGFSRKFPPTPVARKIEDGDELGFGEKKIKVIHTPGHTPGSCCFLIGKHLFSGDTLFRENVGRWDLEGGNLEDLKQSIAKLLELPADTVIHPGHDNDWTIGEAKKFSFPI